MQALRRLASTGTSKVSISDTPSTFDIIYEAEGDPEATIQVGSMVFSLAQFQALLPFPQVALPYMHVPSHYGPLPVTFYGVVLPTAERKALAAHPGGSVGPTLLTHYHPCPCLVAPCRRVRHV